MSLITTEMLKANYDPKISMLMSQYAKAIIATRNETVDEVLEIIEHLNHNGSVSIKLLRKELEVLKGE